MDRRTVLAIILIMIVAILPSLLFPPRRPPPPRPPPAPGGPEVGRTAGPPLADAGVATAPPPAELPAARAPDRRPARPDSQPERLVTVESPLYRYVFSTRGGRLVGATLNGYRSFAPRDSGPAQLIPDSSRFLAYSLVFGRDTVDLSSWAFEPSATHLEVSSGGGELGWVARRGAARVVLRYLFVPDDYLFTVAGDFRSAGSEGGLVLVGLGPGLRMIEADSASDSRSYAVVTKARSTEKLDFRSLDPSERRELGGPFEWVALKSMYFLAAALTLDPGAPQFGGVVAVGGQRTGRYAMRMRAAASLPAPGGMFTHSVYVGPQEYRRLARIGHDLTDVNPYGWIFRPIIQPFSVLIVKILLWMHEHLKLAYGWVLILFGLAVRVALWPLNQKAMKSSVAMQAIQPEMKALQDRYKKDPQKLQQEMMKLYRAHGVNPLGGCVPMLIPMPVLFALFFVFANTIEFRGVPFLWLPDLSRADPWYIIPVVMGLSMYGLTKIGQIGLPPNPQAKMMLYLMPIMFTVLFLNFSSGLNLYYAVSNIASIPQQWLIARARLRRFGRPAA